MQIGFIGLGKMGVEMSTRAVRDGHDLIGYDVSASSMENAKNRNIPVVDSLDALINKLEKPRIVWLQVPPGKITNNLIEELSLKLESGDLLIDGGNSDFRDSFKHGKKLENKGIQFMDIGVSGGVKGARDGCGLLIGASKENYNKMIPFFQSLAAPDGYAYCGETGCGHYAKAIHNGIQYAIMQAYAEGYEMLVRSDMHVDVLGTMNAYQNGCSIRSYILGQTIEAIKDNVTLDGVKGYVSDSGMGRWTVEESIRLKVPTPAITASLQARFASQCEESPAMKCLAAMRGTIGGHVVKHEGEK